MTQQNPDEFAVTTSQLNKSLVEEVLKSAFPNAKISPPVVDDVVTGAVLKAFENELSIEQNLHPEIISAERISERLADSSPELAEFLGGVKLEVRISTPATADEINQRINNLRFKPGTQNIAWYTFKVLNADLTVPEHNKPLTSFAYVSATPKPLFANSARTNGTSLPETKRARSPPPSRQKVPCRESRRLTRPSAKNQKRGLLSQSFLLLSRCCSTSG